MGCLWSCCGNEGDDGTPTARTPLLQGRQANGSSRPAAPGASSSSSSLASSSQQQPASARRYRTEDPKKFLTSIEKVTHVEFGEIPVSKVNKTFQDHGNLYNEVVNNYEELRSSLHDFKSIFVPDTAGIPILSSCLQVLRRQCGDAKLTARRTKFSLQVEYDIEDVCKYCTVPSSNVLQSLELLNKVARSARLVLERAPQVQQSIQLVIEDEGNMSRLVGEECVSSKDGAETMHTFKSNLTKLRRLPEHLETLQRHADSTFRELLEASKALFAE